MWKYKGIDVFIKIGDNVKISQQWARKLNVSRDGVVTGLCGFITVKLSNGDNVDFDARSISPNFNLTAPKE